MNKHFNYNDILYIYIYITVMGQVNKSSFFLTQNSKVRFDVIKFIYKNNNNKERTKAKENFYSFGETK